MNIVAIIPARGGSKRIRRKNIKMLGGKPLLAYTIEAALAVPRLNRVVVSTEDPEIKRVAQHFGAEVIDRPAELASDEAKTEPTLFHAVETLERDGPEVALVVLLQPTSPLRTAEHIEAALDQFFAEGADSLLSVTEEYRFFWKAGRPINYSLEGFESRPRHSPDEMAPMLKENGAIYVTSREVLLKQRNRLGGKIAVFRMPPETETELDRPEDWATVQRIVAHEARIVPGRTFIVAEMGCNHMGDMDIARQMIDIAHYCGVDAVKGQKRCIPELLSDEEYNRPYTGPNSFGPTYGQHREALELTIEQHQELAQRARSLGMAYFVSVWDTTSARRAVEELHSYMIKIPSAKLATWPMLELLRDSEATLLLSVGMSTMDEIDRAVELLSGGGPLYLLQCTSAYPLKFEDVHLRVMQTLRERYGDRIAGVGFSGHHLGIAVDSAAVAMGAQVLERHFTLDRTSKGTDQAASLEPGGLRKLVRDVRAVERAMGAKEKEVLNCELAPRKKLRGD